MENKTSSHKLTKTTSLVAKVSHHPLARGGWMIRVVGVGPYVPGCTDIMLEYSQSGIFARLYYPTNEKHQEVDQSKWITWITHANYFMGSARGLLFLPIMARFLSWCFSLSDILTPVLYGARVKQDKKLPCIVLSHGYAGNRQFYSVISTELASRGYLVAVIEHRDESAGYTYFYNSKEDAAADIKTMLYAKQIPMDQNYYSGRNKQIRHRANECIKLLDFLIDLNNGKLPHNVLNDLKDERDVNFEWKNFVGLLDLSNITISGHSFGAATALYTLSLRKEFKQGIILDPWMYPIKREETTLQNVTQPLIFINSETFHSPGNVEEMGKYLQGENREMYTILHTTHEIQADMAVVMGFWMNPFKRKISALQAADINNGLILQFLKKCTGNSENIEDCEVCLKKEDTNICKGLTKPWA